MVTEIRYLRGKKYKGRSAPESTVNVGKTPIQVILTEKVNLLGEVTVEQQKTILGTKKSWEHCKNNSKKIVLVIFWTKYGMRKVCFAYDKVRKIQPWEQRIWQKFEIIPVFYKKIMTLL